VLILDLQRTFKSSLRSKKEHCYHSLRFVIIEEVMQMVAYEHIQYKEKQSIHILHHFLCQEDTEPVIKQHFHRSLEIILPVIGGVHILCNGNYVHIKTGEVYIINSRDMHSVIPIFDKGYYMGFVFQIPYSVLTYCNPDIDTICFRNNTGVFASIVPILYKLLSTYVQMQPYQFIELTELTLQLMKTLLIHYAQMRSDKVTNIQSDKILSITEYLKANFYKTLKITDIAKHFHYSYGHLEKIFKENTGVTILQFINQIRLLHVENALINERKTILEISESVGFRNVKSLNQKFKEKHGVTPKQYRNAMRKRLII